MWKKICCFAFLLAALALLACSCSKQPDARKDVGAALGLDLSAAEVTEETDDHGGFHSDGTRLVTLRLPDDTLAEALAADPAWQPLPLTDEALTALLYGHTTADGQSGPYLADADGAALLPAVEHGFCRFIDRHTDAADPADAAAALVRASFNFTVALYDADSRTLYYAELDT